MYLLLLTLLGCIDETGCTSIAVYSTTVAVTDSDGTPIEGVTLTYTVDGEGPLACDELSPAEYACGLEASGHFVITASRSGYADATAEVDVGADECHPIPEAVSIVLEPVDCTDVEVPSIVVALTGSGGETLEDPQVAYTFGDTQAPIACESADGVTWICDQENAGDYVIDAIAAGHEGQSVPVTVVMDEAGCHPVTEEVAIALEWLPD